MTVDELHAELQRAATAGGKLGGAASTMTKQQLLDAVRLLDDVATFDERTGVVRPRATARA